MALRVSYLLADLRYIEYGLQSQVRFTNIKSNADVIYVVVESGFLSIAQHCLLKCAKSFRLEFAQPSGCHTYLVGDAKYCEDFLKNLRGK